MDPSSDDGGCYLAVARKHPLPLCYRFSNDNLVLWITFPRNLRSAILFACMLLQGDALSQPAVSPLVPTFAVRSEVGLFHGPLRSWLRKRSHIFNSLPSRDRKEAVSIFKVTKFA